MKKLLLYFSLAKIFAFTGAYLATQLAPISYKFTAAYDFGADRALAPAKGEGARLREVARQRWNLWWFK